MLDRAINPHSRGHDASRYRLVPLVVVIAGSIQEIAAVLVITATHRVPVTFRSGGTSLSGQCLGTGILVDTCSMWPPMSLGLGGTASRRQHTPKPPGAANALRKTTDERT